MVLLLLWTLILPLRGNPSGPAMTAQGEEGTCKVNADGSQDCSGSTFKLDPRGAEDRLTTAILNSGGIVDVESGESFALKDKDGNRIRGLLAISNIESGSTLLKIPAKFHFTAETDAQWLYDIVMQILVDKFGEVEEPDHYVENCGRITLAASLIHERRQVQAGKPSQITDYIHMLPEKGPPNMAYFTGPERDALELENTHFMDLREMGIMVLQTLGETQEEFAKLSTDEITWGFSHSLSRAQLDVVNGTLRSKFIPVFDLANHEDEDVGHPDHFNAYTEMDHNGAVVVRSTRGIPKGEEVSIFYGTLSQIQMVALYGFVPGWSEISSIKLFPEVKEYYQDECKSAIENGVYLPASQVTPYSLHLCEGHGSKLVLEWAEDCEKKLSRWKAERSSLADDPMLLQTLDRRGHKLVAKALRADLRVLRRCADTPHLNRVDTLPTGGERKISPGQHIR